MTEQEAREWREWWERDVAPKLASTQATREEVIETLTAAGPIPAQSEARGARE